MNAFRIAVRSLARSPGFTAAAVLTLALGIGASTAMFSLMHASLLQPLPYDAPDQLVRFRDHYLPTGGSGAIMTGNFTELARDVRGAELAAYSATSVNVAGDDRPERAPALLVTSNFLRTLGVSPALGRGFADGEDRAGREDMVVISSRVWLDRFQGRADVIGQAMLLDARPHTVVGVLPPSFWYPGEPELLLPFAFTPEELEARGNRWLEGIARLAPGTSLPQLHAEMNVAFDGIRERSPAGNEEWGVWTAPLGEWAVGNSRTSLLIINGAVLVLLLIGCVNVANLMLVRAERRSREVAMRVALGAGRARIAGQYLGEAMLLAALGAIAGVIVASHGVHALVAIYGDSLPRASAVGISAPVLLFAAGVSVLTGLLVGLVPVLRTRTTDFFDTLREGGRGAGSRSSRLQHALVTAEVALAVMLVAGAALLVNSFWRLNAVDTGLQLDNAMVFSVQLPPARYPGTAETARFYDRALAGIHALPGVVSAGVSERTPLQGGFNITRVASPLDPEISAEFVEIRSITPGFFAAAGIPILAGRGITDHDLRDDANVVVINDEVARTLFGDSDPIGQRFGDGETAMEVVGVAGSVREFGVTREKRPGLYFPLQKIGQANSMVFVVRTAGQPLDVVPGIRRVIGDIDATLPIYQVQTMRDVVTHTMGSRWLATNLFAAFGSVALFLAAFGIFGVLAYVVEQRTRDIGIRMALGASARRVRIMVVAQGLKLTIAGLAIGVAAAFYASRIIADLLWEIEPTDATTFVLAATVTLGTAIAAALIPAVRATRIAPAVALMRD